jgi:hypothetical protein
MADRKQFEEIAIPDPKLIRLLESTRDLRPSEDDLREQRISFAYGNALGVDSITKDSVRAASKHIRLLP